MSDQPSPYQSASVSASKNSKRSRNRRLIYLLFSALAGLLVGSYISSELLYVRFPDSERTINEIVSHTIGSVISSQLAMTLGLFATFKFAGLFQVCIAVLGILLSLLGTIFYFRNGKKRSLLAVFVGFVCWAHNNHLAFAAV